MRKQILTIMAAAMIAGSITSCSKDADDITVDQIDLNVTTEDVKTQVINTNNIVYSADTKTIGIIKNANLQVIPVFSDQKVTYKSSDESIATVDEEGYVTASGEGDVEITASIGDKITAKQPVFCFAPSVTINREEYDVVKILYYYSAKELDLYYNAGNGRNIIEIYHNNGKITQLYTSAYGRKNIQESDNCTLTIDKKTGKATIKLVYEKDDFSIKINTTVTEYNPDQDEII